MNTTSSKVSICIKRYNIIKSNEQLQEMKRRNCLEKYGVTSTNKLASVREKAKQTSLARYGVDNIFKDTQKIKQAMLDKYGVDNCAKIKSVREKVRKTCQERYGGCAPSCSNIVKWKTLETNLAKFGGAAPISNIEIYTKICKTNKIRYGSIYPMQNEDIKRKCRETCLRKYGVEFVLQSEVIKYKAKQTYLRKYGVEHSSSSYQVKQKIREVNLKKYGFACSACSPVVRKKAHRTLWKNGKLRQEQEILQRLLLKFNNVKTQYDEDPRYPYPCDFYIPSLDLFIEYNGYVAHGFHPFNPNDPKDISVLHDWQDKAKIAERQGRTTQYSYFIKIWTQRDPEKVFIAKKNNANLISFYNMNQFNDWYDKI